MWPQTQIRGSIVGHFDIDIQLTPVALEHSLSCMRCHSACDEERCRILKPGGGAIVIRSGLGPVVETRSGLRVGALFQGSGVSDRWGRPDRVVQSPLPMSIGRPK